MSRREHAMNGSDTLRRLTAVLALIAGSGAAIAQEKPAPAPPVAPAVAPQQPEKEPPKGDDGTLPSLDELLGLPTSKDPKGIIPDDPTKTDLDRLLSGAEIGDAFSQTVTLMGDIGKRMQEAKDAGLTTQRMQEAVLRRLDQLISSLEQQQQQQQSSQSSSSQQQQQSQANQNVPGQKQQENQQQQGDNTGQTSLPGRQDGTLRPALDAARASWGNLPERVRDMLLQGSNDRFSSLYDAMTQSYYRKLAEEARQR